MQSNSNHHSIKQLCFGLAVRVHQVALKQGLIFPIGTISNGEVARKYLYIYTFIYKRFPPKLETLHKREQYIFCQFEDVSQNLKQALEIHLLAAAAL